MVEHFLGKEEVGSSILLPGFLFLLDFLANWCVPILTEGSVAAVGAEIFEGVGTKSQKLLRVRGALPHGNLG